MPVLADRVRDWLSEARGRTPTEEEIGQAVAAIGSDPSLESLFAQVQVDPEGELATRSPSAYQRPKRQSGLSRTRSEDLEAALGLPIWHPDERRALEYLKANLAKIARHGAMLHACVSAGWIGFADGKSARATAATRLARLIAAACQVGSTIRHVSSLKLSPFKMEVAAVKMGQASRSLRRRTGRQPPQRQVEADLNPKMARIRIVAEFEPYGLDPFLALYLLDALGNLRKNPAIIWCPAGNWWPKLGQFRETVERALDGRRRGLTRDNLATLAVCWLQALLRQANEGRAPRRRNGLRAPLEVIADAVGPTFGLEIGAEQARERGRKLNAGPAPIDLLLDLRDFLARPIKGDDEQGRKFQLLNLIQYLPGTVPTRPI